MYVFDNNSFRELGSYYPNQFPSFWIEFNRAVEDTKIITSVREVYRELEFYTRPRHDHITNWVKEHRSIFNEPSIDERNFVNQILSTKNFKDMLRHEHLYEGKPCADPFIIAAAKSINACVVTEESKNLTLQIFPMYVIISTLNARTYKDSWKEKDGNSKTS